MKKKNKREKTINRHFVFVEAPIDLVAPEIIAWGEAEWWPENCAMQFARISGEPNEVGARYQMKVKKLFGPQWQTEIEELIPGRLVKRKFLDGMFDGYEMVKISERSNGTRVDYEMHYAVKGLMNKIFWNMFSRKNHDANLVKILKALKAHVLQKNDVEIEKKGKE